MNRLPVETFSPLNAFPWVLHGFIQRVPGVDVNHEREEAMARLAESHTRIREGLGMGGCRFVTAEQVHGNGIAVVGASGASQCPGVDGLVTNQPGICLGIYVADCGPVYLLDPVRRAIGLVHSGKKGTELGIVSEAIAAMGVQFGSKAADLVAVLGPCIRPPHYDLDFAADIVRQCEVAGAGKIHDSGANTGADLERYYSYRVEKGRTGRMLALLAMLPKP